MRKPHVVVLCGGKSSEYEVSLWSASNLLTMIDQNRYKPGVICISQAGAWGVYDRPLGSDLELSQLDFSRDFDPVCLSMSTPCRILNAKSQEAIQMDVAVPCMHGQYGEDGTIQGLLNALGIPFVGSGATASALGFDKLLTKQILQRNRIPVVDYVACRPGTKPSFADLSSRLGIPMVLKPARSGSSVGVRLIKTQAEFDQALSESRELGVLMFERYLKAREIECAVLADPSPRASTPGEIRLRDGRPLYDYDAKYQNAAAVDLVIPAELPGALSAKVRELAVLTHETLGCEGLSRVDFFVSNGDVYVNEINTMPGFTKHSMYPMMWEKTGVNRLDLATSLIEAGLRRGSPAP